MNRFYLKIIFFLSMGFIFPVSPAFAVDYTYDFLGRLKQVTYENGHSITYTYDTAGNIVSVIQKGGSGTIQVAPQVVEPKLFSAKSQKPEEKNKSNGTPPLAATLISPSGTVSDKTPAYNWKAVPSVQWYYLLVKDSSGNDIKKWYKASDAGCASGSGTCSVTPDTVIAGNSGRWWIRTYSGKIFGPWSRGGAFRIGSSEKPHGATLVSPSGIINSRTPTYTWNAVPLATWYYHLIKDSTGKNIKKWYKASEAGCVSGRGTCSVTPNTAMPGNSGIWWVKTYNKNGFGPWSKGIKFSVGSSSQ
jgi:YD repeat-containing protein